MTTTATEFEKPAVQDKPTPAARPARVITVASRKGGVGKTTLSLLLAETYQRAGKRVLALDLDPQGSLGLAFGLNAPRGGGASAIIECGEVIESALTETSTGVRIALSGPDLEPMLADPPPLDDIIATADADVVIIDCPPGFSALDRSAMAAADVVLSVAEPHRLALAGARRALAEAEAITSPPRCALVLGRLDKRRSLDRQAPELLAGAFSVPIFVIPQDAALAVAINSGRVPARGRALSAVREVVRWIEGGAF